MASRCIAADGDLRLVDLEQDQLVAFQPGFAEERYDAAGQIAGKRS